MVWNPDRALPVFLILMPFSTIELKVHGWNITEIRRGEKHFWIRDPTTNKAYDPFGSNLFVRCQDMKNYLVEGRSKISRSFGNIYASE